MSMSLRQLAGGTALMLLVVASTPAMAAEPLPGLWQQTTTSDMSGTEMPQMPTLPPDVLAQMQAAGMQMPNMNFNQPRTETSLYCITAEEIAARQPFDSTEEMDGCTQENLETSDSGMSVDLVCTGEMTGNGRIEYIFDSATHYSGTMTLTGSSEGRAMSMNNTIEGIWQAADCGNVE